MASAGTRSGGELSKKGLRLEGKKGLVPHKPYVVGATEKGGRVNANKINKGGDYMAVTCTSCLSAPQYFDEKQPTGIGATTHNEYFCCKADPKYGINGTQCGRCVGMGQGVKCQPVPPELYDAARDVVKCGAAYNLALKHRETVSYNDLTEAEKKAIRNMVKAATEFSALLKGKMRNAGSGVVSTPTKRKREHDVDEASILGRVNLDRRFDDLRTDFKKTSADTGVLGNLMGDLINLCADTATHARNNERLLRADRARQRVLLTNVERIGQYLIDRDVAESTTEVNGVEIVGQPPFELVSVKDEDLIEESDEEAEESPEGDDA